MCNAQYSNLKYSRLAFNKSTYTLLLPLVLGVCHHALHALLHALLLRQLSVQPLLPCLQLLLKGALVLLIHVGCLLQDIDLKRRSGSNK